MAAVSFHTNMHLSSFCCPFRQHPLLQRPPARRHGAAAFRFAAIPLELSIVACRKNVTSRICTADLISDKEGRHIERAELNAVSRGPF
jgi:hypothetical protein